MNAQRLRFKDDDGQKFPEWEEKSLENFLIPEFREVKKPQEPYLAIGIRSHCKGTFQKPEANPEKNAMDNLFQVKENDLIVNITFAWEGAIAIVKKEDNNGLVSHRFPTYIFREEITNSKFFQYVFIRPRFREQLDLISPGGAGRNRVMSKKDFLKIKCELPTVPEQTKIANFLMAVDEKIAQLTQKADLLARYKKGVMQQIFSLQLRFKDDDGREFPEWEEKELGGLCSITTGKLDANAMVENGEYRFYTCAKEYYQIDKYAFDTDALLVSGNGANVGYIHHYKGKFNAYQRTYVLDGFEQNIVYVRYFLDANLYARIFKEKKDGNTPYIVLGTLAEMQVLLPSLPEQTKIANFLTAIDDKITQNQTQLDALKQYKQGLLQQLFV